MSRRAAARIAWSLWGLTVLLTCAAVAFAVLTPSTAVPGQGPFGAAFDVIFGIVSLSFATVGAIVASRRPENPIGWLFCSGGVPMSLSNATHGYSVYALFTDPGSLPAGQLAAWFDSWTFLPPLLGVPVFLFLLVPDGRLLSPRWRPWSGWAPV